MLESELRGAKPRNGERDSSRIKPPLVSIVTVCLNSEKTISRAIESVLSQTYPNIEYVVIDGHSIDGTVETIRKYASRFAGIGRSLKWISEPDKGISDAFNKGIGLSSGEVIGIVNSDDWLEPDGVETIVAHLDREHAVYCGTLRFFGKRPGIVKLRRSRPSLLPLGMYVMHPTVFVKREAYSSYLFDPDLLIAMDYDLLLRFRKGGLKIKTIDKVITNMQGGGASFNMREMRTEEKLVMRRHLPRWQYLVATAKVRMEEFAVKRLS